MRPFNAYSFTPIRDTINRLIANRPQATHHMMVEL